MQIPLEWFLQPNLSETVRNWFSPKQKILRTLIDFDFIWILQELLHHLLNKKDDKSVQTLDKVMLSLLFFELSQLMTKWIIHSMLSLCWFGSIRVCQIKHRSEVILWFWKERKVLFRNIKRVSRLALLMRFPKN